MNQQERKNQTNTNMKLNEQLSRIKEMMDINEASQPITVYHGSNTKITNFVDDFVGGEQAQDLEGPGIYFTTIAENAEYFGTYVHEVTITPRKLLTERPNGGTFSELIKLARMAPDWEYTAQNWAENEEIGLNKAIKEFISYNHNQKDRFLQVWIDFYKNDPIDYVRNCVKLGYDGIVVDRDVIDGKPLKHYIIYNPSVIQIKKVTQV